MREKVPLADVGSGSATRSPTAGPWSGVRRTSGPARPERQPDGHHAQDLNEQLWTTGPETQPPALPTAPEEVPAPEPEPEPEPGPARPGPARPGPAEYSLLMPKSRSETSWTHARPALMLVLALLIAACGTATLRAPTIPAPASVTASVTSTAPSTSTATADATAQPVAEVSVVDGRIVLPEAAELLSLPVRSIGRFLLLAGPTSPIAQLMGGPDLYRASLAVTLEDGEEQRWVLDSERPLVDLPNVDLDLEALHGQLGRLAPGPRSLVIIADGAAAIFRPEAPTRVRAAVGPRPQSLRFADATVELDILRGSDDRPADGRAAWLQPGPAPGDIGAALVLVDDGSDLLALFSDPGRLARGGVRTEHEDGSVRHWENAYFGPVEYTGWRPRPQDVLSDSSLLSEVAGPNADPVLLVLSGNRLLTLREVPDPRESIDIPPTQAPGPTLLRFDVVGNGGAAEGEGSDEVEVVVAEVTTPFVPLVADDTIGWVQPGGSPGEPRRTMLVAGAATELSRHIHASLGPAVALMQDALTDGETHPLDDLVVTLQVGGITQRWVPVRYQAPFALPGMVGLSDLLLLREPPGSLPVHVLLYAEGVDGSDAIVIVLNLAPSEGGQRGYVAAEDPHFIRLEAAMDRYAPFDWRRYVRDVRIRRLPDASGRVVFNSTWDGAAWRISGRHVVEFHSDVGNWSESFLEHVVLHELAHVWQASRWGTAPDDSRAPRVRDLWSSVDEYPSLREECGRQQHRGDNFDRCLGLEIVADCLAAYWGSSVSGSYLGDCSPADIERIGVIYEANALAPPPAREADGQPPS